MGKHPAQIEPPGSNLLQQISVQSAQPRRTLLQQDQALSAKERYTITEKDALRDGRIPDEWTDKPAKIAQKDRDARWTVKYTKAKPRGDGSQPPVDLAISAFSHKNHVSIDHGSFVRTIGLVKARLKFGLANPTYNMRRLVWLRAKYATA